LRGGCIHRIDAMNGWLLMWTRLFTFVITDHANLARTNYMCCIVPCIESCPGLMLYLIWFLSVSLHADCKMKTTMIHANRSIFVEWHIP
jgi:hypothetical protein